LASPVALVALALVPVAGALESVPVLAPVLLAASVVPVAVALESVPVLAPVLLAASVVPVVALVVPEQERERELLAS